jgi:hypothetical protein
MDAPILDVRDVSLSFRGVKALSELSFSVARREICALIGPNGAGKSSLLNIINGVYRASSGEIIFDGEPFQRPTPMSAAQRGIGRTFQNNARGHPAVESGRRRELPARRAERASCASLRSSWRRSGEWPSGGVGAGRRACGPRRCQRLLSGRHEPAQSCSSPRMTTALRSSSTTSLSKLASLP